MPASKMYPYIKKQFLLLFLLLFSVCARATHIVGADMYYAHVTGNTYKITVVLYGDCGPASAAAFAQLPTSHPEICVYNGNTFVSSLSLNIEPPSLGVEITPVCPDSLAYTQCVNVANPIPGIKRFIYSGNYTLPSTSNVWRFIYNANVGASGTTARAAAITNIVSAGTTNIQLIDTLNNVIAPNTSPIMSVIPTPFFCLNQNDGYNPGAVDVNGDHLVFSLVSAVNGTTNCTTVGANVTYLGNAWPGQPIGPSTPLQCLASSYSFDPNTGQILFFPNFIQRSVVVYNIREFRGGVLVGTCQREMTFLVRPCVNLPPSGVYDSATAGTIVDSTHFEICANSGPFSIFINPTDPEGHNINVSATGLPTGATFTTTGNGTATPHCTFSWNSTGVAPGVYVFFVTFQDNACPVMGTFTRAFVVTILPALPSITGGLVICPGTSTTLAIAATGGTWSVAPTTVATVNPTGVVTGISPGTATVTYSRNGCRSFATVTVDPTGGGSITGPSLVCAGSSITLTPPSSGGTWSVSGSGATVSPSGVVTGITPGGTVTISYTTTTSCGLVSYLHIVTVGVALPVVGPITGPFLLCVTTTITLSNSTPGGTWSSGSGNASVNSSGVVTGLSTGTATISYTVSNSCGSVTVTKVVTVDPAPPSGVMAGPTSVCVGDTIILTFSAPGGTWSAAPMGVATISPTGVVTGISGGTATISYVIAYPCGNIIGTRVIVVNPLPTVGPITGPSSVCITNTIMLGNSTPGGTWSSGSSNASVSSSGVVTGVSVGTAVITYTVSNICDTVFATKVVTVNPAPPTGVMTGLTSVCVGDTITLSFSLSGGTWSSSASGTGSVTATGDVVGVAAGTVTISYVIPNPCGNVIGTQVITVNPQPTVGPITGPTSVCVGNTITLSNSTPGGTWSTTSSNATVSSTGVVTGVTTGTALISYTVGNMCDTISATTVITINPLPPTGVMSGPTSVCVGDNITLSFSLSGGTWSTSASGTATVSATGVVTGISAGTVTISYVIPHPCGNIIGSQVITVNPLPTVGPITGPASVCVGSTITLSNATPGGTWSTPSTTASVNSSGVVTGISSGTALISYTVANMCDTISATFTVTVDTPLAVAPITGPDTLCVGTSITLLNLTPGGTWSSVSTGVATISASGVVTGIAGGTATISYALSNSCGTVAATMVVTVMPLPVVTPILGASSVCVGLTITLTCATPGGTWSSIGTATVSPAGVVTGVSGGTATISYSVSNNCGTVTVTKVVTVDLFPDAGTISGPDSVCEGSAIVLVPSLPGGTWSTSSAGVSVSATGVVSGIASGTATITYTRVNGCGPANATYVLTVNPTPSPGIVSATAVLCVGGTVTLSSTVPGGVWSSTGAATVSPIGVVTGVSAGTATISYTVSLGPCSAYTTYVVTVNTLPDPGVITADTEICIGETITVTASVPGGVWNSSHPSVTISSSGVVTGVSYGGATISYTVTNMCGPATATKFISVFPLPDPGDITGTHLICMGSTATLTGTSPFGTGTWVSSNTGVATVDVLGLVSTVAPGITTISYTVTNSAGCTGVIEHIVTVAPLPAPGIISGIKQACVDANITLTQTESGGTWSSSNTAVASIDPVTGKVTVIGSGTTIITYTSAPNSYGCSAKTTHLLGILNQSSYYINEIIENTHCHGGTDGSIKVWASHGSGPWDITWDNGGTTATITGLAAGRYEVTMIDVNTACKAREAYTIDQPDSLFVQPTIKDEKCFMSNGAASVTVDGGTKPYNYLWYNGSTEDHVSGLVKGTYVITVSDKNECKKELFLDVIDGGCEEIGTNDGVSPNGDGYNDTWVIRGIENYPNNLVQLYDKWGDLVYEKRNYDNRWDGTGRTGKPLPDGTYFYVIKLNAENAAGGKNVLTGALLVKR